MHTVVSCPPSAPSAFDPGCAPFCCEVEPRSLCCRSSSENSSLSSVRRLLQAVVLTVLQLKKHFAKYAVSPGARAKPGRGARHQRRGFPQPSSHLVFCNLILNSPNQDNVCQDALACSVRGCHRRITPQRLGGVITLSLSLRALKSIPASVFVSILSFYSPSDSHPHYKAAILSRISPPRFSNIDFVVEAGDDAFSAINSAITTAHDAGGGRVVIPAGSSLACKP